MAIAGSGIVLNIFQLEWWEKLHDPKFLSLVSGLVLSTFGTICFLHSFFIVIYWIHWFIDWWLIWLIDLLIDFWWVIELLEFVFCMAFGWLAFFYMNFPCLFRLFCLCTLTQNDSLSLSFWIKMNIKCQHDRIRIDGIMWNCECSSLLFDFVMTS